MGLGMRGWAETRVEMWMTGDRAEGGRGQNVGGLECLAEWASMASWQGGPCRQGDSRVVKGGGRVWKEEEEEE